MNGEVTFMNCRQYINVVSNRLCYSSKSSSHHKTTTKHFAGRRYYYLSHNPSVLSGARNSTGTGVVGGQIKRSDSHAAEYQQYHINKRKAARMPYSCYQLPQLYNHNTENTMPGINLHSLIVSTRF